MRETDVVVIGGGSAGLTAAYTAKGFGKKVVLIEMNKLGGECTWSGCIPSKAFISRANDIYTAKKYASFEVDSSLILKQVREVVQKVYRGESTEVLEKDDISVINGQAKFVSPNVIEVGEHKIRAKKFFICSGSSPFVAPIEGLREVGYFTNEDFFLQETLPESMIVLGGGAIGTELAQAMNRLGVSVQIVEMDKSILPKEDFEMTDILSNRMSEEGIHILTGYKALKAYKKDKKIALLLQGVDGKKEVMADKLLLALGRVPRVDGMNLEKAGVVFDKSGIAVSSYLQTSQKHIYAFGDCIGGYMFSHMANVEGIQAVQNAVLPVKRKFKVDNAVWCTFTSPELATVGMTEEEARKKYGKKIRIYRFGFENLDRAKTEEGKIGLVKMVLDRTGKILGASILGDRAGEMISEIQVIRTKGIKFGKIASIIHPYPTYGEAISKLSKVVKRDRILQHPIVKFLKKD